MRCFGFGWDLVSAVAARFVGRGKREEGRGKKEEGRRKREEGRTANREEGANHDKGGNYLKSEQIFISFLKKLFRMGIAYFNLWGKSIKFFRVVRFCPGLTYRRSI